MNTNIVSGHPKPVYTRDQLQQQLESLLKVVPQMLQEALAIEVAALDPTDVIGGNGSQVNGPEMEAMIALFRDTFAKTIKNVAPAYGSSAEIVDMLLNALAEAKLTEAYSDVSASAQRAYDIATA